MKKLETYFTNNTVFAVNAIGAFIIGMFVLAFQIYIDITGNVLADDLVLLAIITTEFVSALFIYISYRKHIKNETKALLGVLLTCLFLQSIHSLRLSGFATVSIISAVLITAIFVNHFVLTGSRQSRPVQIVINQLVLIAILLLQIVSYIANGLSVYATQYNTIGLSAIIGSVSGIIVSIMLLCTIVCVESKLDFYKSKRENAGWTEEKGYPADYNRNEYHGK